MKYHEAYPNSSISGEGLISKLSIIEGIPWADIDSSVVANLERAYNVRSGFKTVLDTFLLIPELQRAELIFALFGEKWKKYWDLCKVQYDPLEAYVVIQTGSRNIKRNIDEENKYGKTQNDISIDTGTVKDDGTTIDNSQNNVYGFNSQSPVPSDAQNGNTTDTNTQTRNLSSNRTRTDGGTDTFSKDESEDENNNLSKRGNIGYNSPQKLLREDFELWVKPYFDKVFADIDSYIMLQVY